LVFVVVGGAAALLGACVGTDPATAGEGTGGESSDGTTSESSGESEDSSWTEHSGGLTGEISLPCAWKNGTVESPPGSGEALSTALVTCDPDADEGPVARLWLANTDEASCADPSAQPPCSVGYAAMRIDLPPDHQQVGIHDLQELEAWVDLQGGGTNEDDCGGYVGGGPLSGTVTITYVTPGSIEGHVYASMGDDLDFVGSFEAVPCDDGP
jgi:hypothetical protein